MCCGRKLSTPVDDVTCLVGNLSLKTRPVLLLPCFKMAEEQKSKNILELLQDDGKLRNMIYDLFKTCEDCFLSLCFCLFRNNVNCLPKKVQVGEMTFFLGPTQVFQNIFKDDDRDHRH